jgi:Cys-tRNA(Pro) deacylase
MSSNVKEHSVKDCTMNHPITPAIRYLLEQQVQFEPHLFEYLEKGGTSYSSGVLGIDEHAVIKTLVFETDAKDPLIILMHGDLQVSTKKLARQMKVKSVAPVTPERANQLTGYIVGGTSPFGMKSRIQIYAEKTIFELKKIYINGGKRGFLVSCEPRILHDVLMLNEVEVAQSVGFDRRDR